MQWKKDQRGGHLLGAGWARSCISTAGFCASGPMHITGLLNPEKGILKNAEQPP
jgi:hypothetical protein